MQQPSADFSRGAAYVRGEFLPIAQASVPLTDWGFLRSDATYDVVTVWEGAFFRLDAHLDRYNWEAQATVLLGEYGRLTGRSW